MSVHPTRPHGTATRGGSTVPQSSTDQGYYGRLLRRLPVFGPDPAALQELAAAMQEQAVPTPVIATPTGGGWAPAEPPPPPAPTEPAGLMPAIDTYLGQLADHDLTFDPSSNQQRVDDPDRLVNFRSPRLDLDCLYGRGPADDPFLYDQGGDHPGVTLLIGQNDTGEADLPRNVQGVALTGDPRNDENTVLSQLHTAFLHFHNAVVAHVADGEGLRGRDLLRRAQQVVRWHYQWVIANHYLRRVIGEDLHGQLLVVDGDGAQDVRRRHYRARRHAYMPVEFSGAAFRFGHSQVRGTYRINATVPELPVFSPDASVDSLGDFRGFRPLPAGWAVSWPFLVDLDDTPAQRSRPIDTRLAEGLFHLPGHEDSLALLNLKRGLALRLPAGQDVARGLRATPLSDAELAPWGGGPAPLWFYVLKEAEVRHGGLHLGEVGGRIVGETILGVLEADPPVLPVGAADLDPDAPHPQR